MTWFIPDIIKEVARYLRKNMTESEKKLWKELQSRKIKYKFLRQKPIYLYNENTWLERYVIPDFCSLELKLIIEVDWNIHSLEEIYLLDLEKEKLLI
jgi:very-short-patch-repair endonuclease